MVLRLEGVLLYTLILSVALATPYLIATANTFTSRLNEKRLGDCTLQALSTDDCDFISYATRVVVLSLPGLLVAIGILVTYPTYLVGKYIFNCFGGRRPSRGFCCPKNDKNTEGDETTTTSSNRRTTQRCRYRKADILRSKVAVYIAAIGMIFAFGWGVFGAVQVTKGSIDIVDQVGGIQFVLRDQISVMEQELIFETYDPSTNLSGTTNFLVDDPTGREVKSQALDVISDVELTLQDVNDGIKGVMGKYSTAFYFIFVFPVGIVIVGVAFALFNRRGCLPVCIFHAMAITGMLAWILQVALTGVTIVSYDLCNELSALSDRELNLLIPLSGCKDEIFSDFRSQFKAAEQVTAKEACDQIAVSCYDETQPFYQNVASNQFLQCPDNLQANCSILVRFTRLARIVNSEIFIHANIASLPNAASSGYTCNSSEWQYNCTFERCATDCIDSSTDYLSDFGKQSKNVSLMVKGAQQVVNTIDRYGARYSLCEPVLFNVMSPLSPGCTLAAKGFAKTTQAAGITGIVLIMGMFSMAWGSKRFMPLSRVHANDEPEARNSRRESYEKSNE